MVTLLKKEKADQLAADPSRNDVTDGVRIYFASDPNVTGPQLSTSIMLVSTKDNGASALPYAVCRSRRKHLDYYDHDPNDDLFKFTIGTGLICNGGITCGGNVLYQPCTSCGSITNCLQLPHNITPLQAHHMAQNFGKAPINTLSEWFDLDMFDAINSTPGISGIRIYFGTNDVITTGPLKPLSIRDAFVIAATTHNTSTGAEDDNLDCNITRKFLNMYNDKYHTDSSHDIPGQDYGELCPNNCNLDSATVRIKKSK